MAEADEAGDEYAKVLDVFLTSHHQLTFTVTAS